MKLKKWLNKIDNKRLIILELRLLPILFLLIIVYFTFFLSVKHLTTNKIIANIHLSSTPIQSGPTVTLIPTPTLTPTPIPTPIQSGPTPIPTAIPQSLKIIFSIGSQAGPEMDDRIVKEAPIHMLSSWYNGTKDLEWMRIQQNDLVPRLYKAGYIVHLITWTDLPEENITTPYGPACGRPYPVSTQVVEDMKQLAQIYNGPGPMYVTLFTEFPTYTCQDNDWVGNENYFRTLKDNYIKIKDIFHEYAPNSKVALSFGGWLSRYDDSAMQGGRSLIPHFADVIAQSDFVAFQSMQSDTNVNDILGMTRILGAYGKPVMLAHYKPANNSEAVFDNDMRGIFTDDVVRQLVNSGLFAFSFMDNIGINQSETSFQLAKSAIQKYAK